MVNSPSIRDRNHPVGDRDFFVGELVNYCRINNALFGKDSFGQVLGRVAGVNRNRSLSNDWAVVIFVVNKVNGTA